MSFSGPYFLICLQKRQQLTVQAALVPPPGEFLSLTLSSAYSQVGRIPVPVKVLVRLSPSRLVLLDT